MTECCSLVNHIARHIFHISRIYIVVKRIVVMTEIMFMEMTLMSFSVTISKKVLLKFNSEQKTNLTNTF